MADLIKRADDVIDFIGTLKLSAGAGVGKPFNLEDWQRDYIRRILGTPHADEPTLRAVRTSVLSMARKNGKALALDTPIPTTEGWRTMGDLVEGDQVFDEHGAPCTVTYATEVMHGRTCYRVEFSNGASLIADADHQWQAERKKTRQQIWTTQEMVDAGQSWIDPFVLPSVDVSRLPPELNRCGSNAVNPAPVKVTAITPVESVPVRCIQVDSPSHLYLAGEQYIPTHNTELAAALCLAFLCGPLAGYNQQIYSAAADRYQAALIYRAMEGMIVQDAELSTILEPHRSTKHIFHRPSNSFYSALSADAKTKHGFNPAFIIYDELAQAPNRELYDVLTTATGAQAEPLTLVISTQSADDHSILSELIDYGQRVQRGEVHDPTFDLTLYAVPDDDDPWLEENWYKANPALGTFRSLDEMRQYASRAQKVPTMEATFRNLYLNQRVDATVHFLTPSVWKACAGKSTPHLLADQMLGETCFAGLDLSAKNDLTALVLAFPRPEHRYIVVPFFWCPGDNLDIKEDKDKVPYRVWVDQDYIEARPGKTIDYGWVAKKLHELSQQYDIVMLAFDRWRIDDFQRELNDYDIDVPMVPHGQGFKDMGPVVEVIEDLVSEAQLEHGGHPVLTWNASNVVVETSPAGDRKLTKQKSTGRIDGIVAMGMALRLAESEGRTYSSVYESEPLMVL